MPIPLQEARQHAHSPAEERFLAALIHAPHVTDAAVDREARLTAALAGVLKATESMTVCTQMQGFLIQRGRAVLRERTG